MFASARTLAVFVVFLVPLLLQAQDQCITAPAADYEITASSGSPIPLNQEFSYTLKNDANVLIRLKDINPFATKCSVSTSTNAYKETAIGSFLGIIGGVANVGTSTPNVTQAKTVGGAPQLFKSGQPIPGASNVCQTQYLNSPVHTEVQRLETLRDRINLALQTTMNDADFVRTNFNDNLQGLIDLQSSPTCGNIVSRAQNLVSRPLFNIATVSMSDPAAPPPPPAPIPLVQAMDQVAVQAQALVGHLNDGLNGACRPQDARPYIDEDSAFLSAIAIGPSSASSAVEQWRAQLKALNTVRANILNAQNSIAAVLSSRQNFTIDTSIHGNQQAVTYTASCSPITPRTIAAPDPAAASSTTPAPPNTPPATGGGAAPAPAANSWSHDFRFGPGPRFVLAGGLVISPLQQVTFSTTATPGGTGATANTIIQQQNSGTRILPIAMLHARYWDQLPPNGWYAWVPNYLSAGVTAKSSDNKGTNIEYLFGPSWSFAERQIFITAGAYAGQQQRLANSLTVGSTTGLSAANLPITQTTIWKPGFAITWAPAGK
jgi:hypothetical protein